MSFPHLVMCNYYSPDPPCSNKVKVGQDLVTTSPWNTTDPISTLRVAKVLIEFKPDTQYFINVFHRDCSVQYSKNLELFLFILRHPFSLQLRACVLHPMVVKSYEEELRIMC